MPCGAATARPPPLGGGVAPAVSTRLPKSSGSDDAWRVIVGGMSQVSLEDLDWNKLASVVDRSEAVLPVAVQNVVSGEVVMVAYVSRDAVVESLRTGRAVFYSTSMGKLHRKGETSGDVLRLEDVRINCDHNSLLFRVVLDGAGACHERDGSDIAFPSCFHHRLSVE